MIDISTLIGPNTPKPPLPSFVLDRTLLKKEATVYCLGWMKLYVYEDSFSDWTEVVRHELSVLQCLN